MKCNAKALQLAHQNTKTQAKDASAEAAGKVHLILMCHVYSPTICSRLLLLH